VPEGSLTDVELRALTPTDHQRLHRLTCSKGHSFEELEKDLLVIPAHHRLVVDRNGDTVTVFVNDQPSSLTFCLSKSAEIQHYMNGLAQPEAEIDERMAQLRRNGATEFFVVDEPGFPGVGHFTPQDGCRPKSMGQWLTAGPFRNRFLHRRTPRQSLRTIPRFHPQL